MSEPEKFDSELADVEELLHTFSPRPARLSQARLMFLAGRESVDATLRRRTTAWLWPAATAAMTVVATVLGVLLSVPRPPVEIERVVDVQRADAAEEQAVDVQPPSPPPSEFALPSNRPRVRITAAGYLRDSQTAVAMGIDALGWRPSPGHPSSQPPAAYGQLRQQLFQQDDPYNEIEDLPHTNGDRS